MNQSGFSTRDAIIVDVATTALIEGAVRDLKDLSKEIRTSGHWSSDGLALGVGRWRPIAAPPLGVEPRLGAWRAWPAEYLK